MLRALITLVFLASLSLAALAQAPGSERPLDDARLERRVLALHKVLRCLVCQNQSIAESNADLARDLRQLVRERIAAGDSDDAVMAFLVGRYGDWVLFQPPVKAETWLLWFGPLALLLLAAFGVVVWYRRGGAGPAAVASPLSDGEQARLAVLLRDPPEADSGDGAK